MPFSGFEQPESDSVNEVRFIAGVRPVDQAGVSRRRGPGSEKRTRFLAFFGVLAVGSSMTGTVPAETPFLVLCETGELVLESEMDLLLRLRADCRVSMVMYNAQQQQGWKYRSSTKVHWSALSSMSGGTKDLLLRWANNKMTKYEKSEAVRLVS